MKEEGDGLGKRGGLAGPLFFFVVLQEPQKLTKEVARDL
jgi:hypothetical protein